MSKKLIKNENGMAMVAVLMTLLMLSLLGVAAISMASSNMKVGLEEREFQGAYYIAEAGATFYMEDLRKEVLGIYYETDDHSEFYSKLSDSRLSETMKLDSDEYFHREYGSQPKAEIELKEIGSFDEGKTRHYIIESTGEVDGVVRKVTKEFTLQWKDKVSNDLEAEYTVFTYGNLDASMGTIEGPIYSLGDLSLGVRLHGSAYSMGDMVIHNNTISDSGKNPDGDIVYSKGNMKITGGTINIPVYSQGTFTMSGGTINSNEEVAVLSKGNMIFTGGTVSGPVYSQGTFTMSGGTINSNEEFAVFSEGNILLTGGGINGSIGSNSIVPDSIRIEGWPSIGDYYLRADTGSANLVKGDGYYWWSNHGERRELLSKVIMPDFPEFPEQEEYVTPEIPDTPEFPNFPHRTQCDNRDSIQLSGGGAVEEYTLSSPTTYIPRIQIQSNRSLKINYNDGDILMVDDFDINQGIIYLEGEGVLNIYVRNYFNVGNGSTKINYVETGNYEEKVETAEKLVIYIDDTVNQNSINFGGGCYMYGSIYAKDLNMSFGCGYNFIGNIITLGDRIEMSGGADANTHLIYAPNAKVRVSGGGNIYGPVIADEFDISGGGKVIFDPEKKLPKNPFPGGAVDEPGDLIMFEGPIREK